jgi:hypothetical protein
MHLALEQVPASRQIWKASELSSWHLPPLHSLLFGCFLAADIRLAVGDKHNSADKQSHVDFVFGSDTSQFAGSHRFSLKRTNGPEGTQKVHVEMNCLTCNPQANKPIAPAALFTFHEIYANLLFREAVSEMKRWLDSKP